ncbi:MAG TPA: NAD(P)-dependent oxidoreductase [Mycobacteriales bacterium]|nr:NAD(P)-dependent oxidoreductase [Mycobacteriales bacterium]
MQTRSRTVGIAGLGNLGMPMALALLDAGWPVIAYDVAPNRIAECARHGARAADSAADLATVGILVLVVPDDAAAEELLETQELMARLPRPAAVVVHSTLLPATAQALAEHARRIGVDYVDAPVSGGDERARAGKLTLMAGAAPGALERIQDYLDTVASTIVHIGPPGAGCAVKLANQLMMFAALAGVHEAMELAGAYGVSGADVLAATRTSTGDSWVAREWGFFDRIAQAYDAAGTPVRNRPWSKDLWEIVAAGRAADLRLPVAGLLSQQLADTVERHAASGRDR